VWTEILSYLKGSVEALGSPGGILPLEEYLRLGKKRSDMTEAQRMQVYELLPLYLNRKKQLQFWDTGDFVFNLWCRLRQHGYTGATLHQVYVDEVQDFTQAELSLLFLICADPNQLLLAGDTAQNIARGVGFRFSDIKTLFHSAQRLLEREAAGSQWDHRGAILVPPDPYKVRGKCSPTEAQRYTVAQRQTEAHRGIQRHTESLRATPLHLQSRAVQWM
jgi:hypothetical protein